MHDVHSAITSWCEFAGCSVTIDAAGNLRALYGDSADCPRLLIGSHLDTVPDAGAFDGIIGVLLGLALIETLKDRTLPFAIELVGFSEEEGVRFGIPFLGSRALIGSLDSALIETIETTIRGFGLDPMQLAKAHHTNQAAGYLEFHIEQGPILERLDLPLGVITAIAGQSRLIVTFQGAANHAGTTPMDMRRDALAGAAEWIVFVEAKAKQTLGLVATVGKLEAHPGATNIVPGTVRASLDVRHACDEVRSSAVMAMTMQAEQIANGRGLTVFFETRMDQAAVVMDARMTIRLQQAVERAGYPVAHLVSGAGHDAMIIAPHIPSSMLFLRSPGGISHHPDESVRVEDVEAAIATGVCFLDQFGAFACTMP